MRCDDIEKMILYVDGVLSDQDSKDLENHMNTCEECRKKFEILVSSEELLKNEFIPDENIDIRVLNSIDKERYVGSNKYRLLNRLNTLKISLKPVAAVFFICLVTALFFNHGKDLIDTLSYLSGSQEASEPVNILVLGNDNSTNTDTVILVNYEPISAQLNLLSIPRDTKVTLKDSPTKISRLYGQGGPELVVEKVKELLKVDINYYVCFDMENVKRFVDLLGGVEFEVESDMKYDDPLQDLHINFKKGKYHLSGDEVVQFLRYRMSNDHIMKDAVSYDGSDFRRIESQQRMLRELISQKIDIKYISKINEIVNMAIEGVETDIKVNELLNIFKNISKLNPGDVNMFILPFKNEEADGEFYVLMNEEEAKEIIYAYFQSKYKE